MPKKAEKPQSLRQSLPLLARIFRHYILPQRVRVALAIVLAMVVGSTTAGIAQIAEPVMNVLVSQERYELLPLVALAVITIYVLRAAAMYFQSIIFSFVNITFIARLQLDLHARIIDKDMEILRGNTSGQLLSRIVNDVNQLRGSTTKALMVVSRQLFTVLALAGVMFYQDWLLALIALVLLPTVGYGVMRLGRRMRKVAGQRQKRMGQFTDVLAQQLRGFKQIKIDAQEDESLRTAEQRRDDLVKYQVKAARIRALIQPLVELLTGVLISGILLYGGFQVANDVRSIGSLVAFLAAFAMMGGPVRQLSRVHVTIQNGLAAAERVFDVMDAPPRVQEAPAARELPRVSGQVDLDGVSFSYDGFHAAISDVDLHAAPGQKIALVGPSGAGKTTVVNLLPRLYDPKAGTVRIDGIDIREVTLDSLRRQIALVSQDVFLFTDTVARNIAFARHDATRDEVERAARAAYAHDFIMEMPEGYDTSVGEYGARLSGGQRQRLAIARAILKDAPILLLDEATSALDSESEAAVQAALAELMKGRTALVIAHRLATVASADCIYVMEEGRVVERGTHSELLAANGRYASLASLQFNEPAPRSTAPEQTDDEAGEDEL